MKDEITINMNGKERRGMSNLGISNTLKTEVFKICVKHTVKMVTKGIDLTEDERESLYLSQPGIFISLTGIGMTLAVAFLIMEEQK